MVCVKAVPHVCIPDGTETIAYDSTPSQVAPDQDRRKRRQTSRGIGRAGVSIPCPNLAKSWAKHGLRDSRKPGKGGQQDGMILT